MYVQMYFTQFLSFPSFGHLSHHLPRASTPLCFYSSVFSCKNSLASARHLNAGSSFGNSLWSPAMLCGAARVLLSRSIPNPETLSLEWQYTAMGTTEADVAVVYWLFLYCILFIFHSLSAFVLKISLQSYLQEYLSHLTPFSASQSWP